MKNESQIDRRDFIVNGLRSLTLGAIVFVSGMLGWRQINADKYDLCTIDLPCRGCSKITGCVDPKVVEYKQKTATKE